MFVLGLSPNGCALFVTLSYHCCYPVSARNSPLITSERVSNDYARSAAIGLVFLRAVTKSAHVSTSYAAAICDSRTSGLSSDPPPTPCWGLSAYTSGYMTWGLKPECICWSPGGATYTSGSVPLFIQVTRNKQHTLSHYLSLSVFILSVPATLSCTVCVPLLRSCIPYPPSTFTFNWIRLICLLYGISASVKWRLSPSPNKLIFKLTPSYNNFRCFSNKCGM